MIRFTKVKDCDIVAWITTLIRSKVRCGKLIMCQGAQTLD